MLKHILVHVILLVITISVIFYLLLNSSYVNNLDQSLEDYYSDTSLKYGIPEQANTWHKGVI